MQSISRSQTVSRRKRAFRNNQYHPRLETLEMRLPLGDAVTGTFIGLWIMEGDSWNRHLDGDGLNPASPRPVSSAFIRGTLYVSTVDRSSASEAPNDVERSSAPARPAEAEGEDSSNLDSQGFAAPAGKLARVTSPPAPLPPSKEIVMQFASAESALARLPAITVGGMIAKPGIQAGAGLAGQVQEAQTAEPTPSEETEIQQRYSQLPVSFVANVGQTDAGVDFVAHMGGATVFLTPTAAVFRIQNPEFRIQNSEFPSFEFGTQNSTLKTQNSGLGVGLHMQLVGGNPNARAGVSSPLETKVNYFIGNDPTQWHANIPTFGRVEYQNVYPGIDLAYYGNHGQLEYDFIVSPGADPNAITLNYAGADDVQLDGDGNLLVQAGDARIRQQAPVLYQEIDGKRQEVPGSFVLSAGMDQGPGTTDTVTFEIGYFDRSLRLVIDPLVMGYSTFLGGDTQADIGYGIAADASGSAYITGLAGTDFPVQNAYQPSYGGFGDVFVSKLSRDGSTLAYSTYLGGGQHDEARSVAVDGLGNAYVTGNTASKSFPITPDAFDPTFNLGPVDSFVAKLNAGGNALLFSTYLGGNSVDSGFGIALDRAGNAYVAGSTMSTDFPTTAGALDTTYNGGKIGWDAFVVKLTADGSTLRYGTYLGGSKDETGYAIAVDSACHGYVTGFTNSGDFPTTPGALDPRINNGPKDAYVVKLSADGSALVYGTYLGGTDNDVGSGIAVDAAGNTYVTGFTQSIDFLTTPTAFDTTWGGTTAFVVKLNAAGSAVAYGTYLGSDITEGVGIALDSAGNAFVTGFTNSVNFPTTAGAFQSTYHGSTDTFLTKVNASGSALVYSTYLGGANVDKGIGIAVDTAGNAYVAGWTASANFPTTPGAFDNTYNGALDAFVSKFCERLCRAPVDAKPVSLSN